MICELCLKVLVKNRVSKILADREKAIKRLNKRSNDACEKENRK